MNKTVGCAFVFSIDLKYDITTAINVLDEVDCDEEALYLAKKHHHYHDYLTILIQKKHQYEEAVCYIKYTLVFLFHVAICPLNTRKRQSKPSVVCY